MSIKRTPPRRVGITEIPDQTTFDNPMTAEEQDELKDRLTAWAQPRTFADCVASTEAVCCHIIEKAGGVRAGSRPITHGPGRVPVGHTWKAEYVLPSPIEPYGALWFALEVLEDLQQARECAAAGKVDDAMAWAWTAGLQAQHAHMKFKWEEHAQRGERNLAGARAAARVRAAQAKDDSAAEHWAARVDARRPGLSREAAYRLIAEQDDATPAAVKKAVQRHSRRHPGKK